MIFTKDRSSEFSSDSELDDEQQQFFSTKIPLPPLPETAVLFEETEDKTVLETIEATKRLSEVTFQLEQAKGVLATSQRALTKLKTENLNARRRINCSPQTGTATSVNEAARSSMLLARVEKIKAQYADKIVYIVDREKGERELIKEFLCQIKETKESIVKDQEQYSFLLKNMETLESSIDLEQKLQNKLLLRKKAVEIARSKAFTWFYAVEPTEHGQQNLEISDSKKDYVSIRIGPGNLSCISGLQMHKFLASINIQYNNLLDLGFLENVESAIVGNFAHNNVP